MNSVFPFGFPGPTAFYLVLYVVTLVSHVLFMNYVIGGAGYLAVANVFGKRMEVVDADDAQRRLSFTWILRDWLPFMLSGVITAGVAPLLFVQILYQPNFYTANLLLFHRWMAILPVLIVGFYGLYVLKSKAIRMWHRSLRITATLIVFACFMFVGYSWTENHLLSLRGTASWADFHASGDLMYATSVLLPRLLVWLVGGLPTMVLMVFWQVWYKRKGDVKVDPREVKRGTLIALAGLIGAGLCGGWYYAADNAADSALRSAVTGPLAGGYFLVAVAAGLVTAFMFVMLYRHKGLCPYRLSVASAAWVIAITCMAVVREAIRLEAVDIESLYAAHDNAIGKAGLPVFLVFTVVNGGLIAYCFRLVRKHRKVSGDTRPVPSG